MAGTKNLGQKTVWRHMGLGLGLFYLVESWLCCKVTGFRWKNTPAYPKYCV